MLDAFQDEFIISSKRYLQLFRLRQVRRSLLQGIDGKDRVVDIANSNGFWHMGQFAADYRAQFGELPSETLRC